MSEYHLQPAALLHFVAQPPPPNCVVGDAPSWASIVLRGEDERTKALRDTIAELLVMDEPRRRFVAMMSGLDIHYDLVEGHPLLGRRMPDLDLVTENGALRVFSLLHAARPVLLNLGEPGGFDITPWADRVRWVDAQYAGKRDLPVIGTVPSPTAVLIRPDGYVAWVQGGCHDSLRNALSMVRSAVDLGALIEVAYQRLLTVPVRQASRRACLPRREVRNWW